jgi:hypothetical protein
MDKTIKGACLPFKPPAHVVEAVKVIENWAASQTDRDDWVIGGVACRKGFERLFEMYKDKGKHVR